MSQAVRPSAGPGGLRPHRGPMILILGLAGVVLACFILGIIAWVMGRRDLEAMAEGRMDPSGETLTRAGKICGAVGVLMSIASVALCVLFLIILLQSAS